MASVAGMARYGFLNAALLAAFLPSGARAEVPPEERQEMLRLVLARGGTAQELTPLVDEVDRAAAAGLPQAPLVNKLKEGLAKGVPLARVHSVLKDLAGNLRSAGGLLPEGGDPSVRARATVVLAEALARGATEPEVQELHRLTAA